jgi:hypothetical protein
VKLLLGYPFQGYEFVHAGVVHQNIDLAEGIFCGGKESLNL